MTVGAIAMAAAGLAATSDCRRTLAVDAVHRRQPVAGDFEAGDPYALAANGLAALPGRDTAQELLAIASTSSSCLMDSLASSAQIGSEKSARFRSVF